MARPKKIEFYEPKEPFVTTFEGAPLSVAAGERVHRDSAIYKGREDLFKPVEPGRWESGVEQATAAPGEKREVYLEPEPDAEPQSVEDLESLTVAELREVAKSRGVTPGTMNKQDLIDAIRLRGS